jgi:DNA-binding CsgD family transcriptional regulator
MTGEDGAETRGQRNEPISGDAQQFTSGIFNSPMLGLGILDTQMRYIAVNDALAAMHGIPPQEHAGKTVTEVLGHAAQTIKPALEHILATGERISSVEVKATLPARDAPGHFRINLFPIKDTSGVVVEIVVLVAETTRLRKFEECLLELMGHLPRVRDQIICLGLPNRQENDKIQSWRGSIEMLEAFTRQIHGVSDLLQPPAMLTNIVPFEPSQLSMPDFTPVNRDREETQELNESIQLPPRQVETLKLLAQGKSNKEIAAVLDISVRTVDHYRERIMLKLELHSLTELLQYALRKKLISL